MEIPLGIQPILFVKWHNPLEGKREITHTAAALAIIFTA